MPEPNPSKKERREAARAARLEAERKQAVADARKRRLGVLGGVLGLAVVVVVAAILISSSGGSGDKGAASDPQKASADTVVGVAETKAMFDGIPQSGMQLGKEGTPATLIQAEDPQCPVCKEYSETVLPQVVQNDVRAGKARVQLNMFPFIGPDSDRGAAFTVAAARQNRAFYALELIYRNQGTENSGYMTDTYLKAIAQAAGLDVNKVMTDMTTTEVKNEVARQEKFATTNGATGTPTLWTQRGGGDLAQVQNFSDAGAISQQLAGTTSGS
jgi:protein-disulfide isomerase